jgi:glutamate-1-semialdehyde 2,1-aminomutase
VRAGRHPPPLFFERGRGARIYDVDGYEYVDYVLGQGPLILGHSPATILEAVEGALHQGQLYAGQHPLEIALSEKLQQIIPCADLVRYSNSGSEIVQAALRLARAYTGRQKYVKFEGHYHGWFDNVLVSVHPALDAAGPYKAPHVVPASAGMAQSVLDDVIVLPWNDLALLEETLDQHGDEIAAVIMEPIMCNTGCVLPRSGYLEGVRTACDRHGAVLIFDEIITGFRVGLGGAQSYFGVTPDLATFGKAMAAGFPVSCLAGKHALMELISTGEVNHSGTLNSNVMAMAAALATVEALEEGDVYEQLSARGQRLAAGVQEAAADAGLNVYVNGPGPMFHVAFTGGESYHDYRSFAEQHDVERCQHFVELLLDEGARTIPRGLWYLSTAHTDEDVALTLAAVRAAFSKL